MNKFRLLAWVLFLSSLVFLRVRSWQANREHNVYNIVKLELATADTGKVMLEQWNKTTVGGVHLLRYATVDTWVDFLFIIGYTAVLLMVSRQLGRKQKRPWLKLLLRWCLPMAVLAGLLDIIENVILLMNMNASQPANAFTSTRYVAGPKFILIALVLLMWLLSLLVNFFQSRKNKQAFIRAAGDS